MESSISKGWSLRKHIDNCYAAYPTEAASWAHWTIITLTAEIDPGVLQAFADRMAFDGSEAAIPGLKTHINRFMICAIRDAYSRHDDPQEAIALQRKYSAELMKNDFKSVRGEITHLLTNPTSGLDSHVKRTLAGWVLETHPNPEAFLASCNQNR